MNGYIRDAKRNGEDVLDKSKERVFIVTPSHMLLLQRMWVHWRQPGAWLGAPIIDGIRPYGNSSILDDIADILSIKPHRAEYGPRQVAAMKKLHRETEVALQILLRCGELRVGQHKASACDVDWRKL